MRLTEEQYRKVKSKYHISDTSKMINKRNKQPEEEMKKEFFQLMRLKFPNEVKYLFRVEPFAFRKLITKENAGIAMGISKQLQNTGYQKGEFDYEFKKTIKKLIITGEGNTSQLLAANALDKGRLIRNAPTEAIIIYCSLHIEFKHGKNKLTIEQEDFKKLMESEQRKCVVCYSAEAAIEEVKKYLNT